MTDAHHYFEIAVLTQRKRDRLCAQNVLKYIVFLGYFLE